MDGYKVLVEKLGKERADKVIKLLAKFEQVASKTKTEIDKLMAPLNHELKIGLQFTEKKHSQEIDK